MTEYECPECGRSVDRPVTCSFCSFDALEAEKARKEKESRAHKCFVCELRIENFTSLKFRDDKSPALRSRIVCWKCYRICRQGMTRGEAIAAVGMHGKGIGLMAGRMTGQQKAEALGQIGSLRIPVEDRSKFTLVTGFIQSAPYENFKNIVVDLATIVLLIERDSEGYPILTQKDNGEFTVKGEWKKFKFRCREKTLISTLAGLPPMTYIGKPASFLFESTKEPTKDGKVYWDTTPLFFETPEEWKACPSLHATPLNKAILADSGFKETEDEFKARNGYTRASSLFVDGTTTHHALSLGWGIEQCWLDYQNYLNRNSQGMDSMPAPVGKKDDDIPF